MKKLLVRRPYYLTWSTAVLLIADEYLCWKYINTCMPCLGTYIIILSLIILGLLILGFRIDCFQGINRETIAKFISNSVEGSIHYLALLFLFIMHLTWFIDIMYGFMVSSNNGELLKALPSFLTMILLLFIIPSYNISSDIANKSLLICPISGLSSSNLQLLCYPFEKNVYDTSSEDSCQLINLTHFVIIPSNEVMNEQFDDAFINDVREHEWTIQAKKELAQSLADAMNKFNGHPQSSKAQALADILSKYVNLYYNRNDIVFKVTSPINYNSLDSVFEKCGEVLDIEESNCAETLLYISPGTKNVSVGLSLYGVKRGRHLLYFEQTKLQSGNQKSKLVAFNPDVNDRNLSSLIYSLLEDKKDMNM